ncbi:PREDICTED: DNA topoisomerase 1-like [Drosophila arizonae]|uniref:DNA topoisomerase 1 n=1 Tax=Drosophila arizonae TaxID=7263 RepID=A0ABM1NPB7_DROAR|nr:PREDICTED: DNA topoisomerase 1-like [Drosophila arizonae]
MSDIYSDAYREPTELDVDKKPHVGGPKVRCQFVPLKYRNLKGHWQSRLRPRQSVAEKPICIKPKWQTLRHNGPCFPADHERLPEDVKFYYDNCPIELTEQAEEVATFYAKLMKTAFVQMREFNQNFFNEFRSCLSEEQRRYITCFELCNFSDISQYLECQREDEKERIAEENKLYGYCLVDGESRRITQFRISRPGLCCPRHGFSTTMGTIRPRVLPEDVVINCDENEEPPAPPCGHLWAAVVHDRTVRWVYAWNDIVTGCMHHAYPRNESSRRSRPPRRDLLDTARRLQQHLHHIRNEYQTLQSSENWLVRQRSVALYCIDRLAMSCDAEEVPAETTVCGLCVQNIKLCPRLGGQRNVLQLLAGNRDCRQREYKRSSIPPGIFYNLSVFICGKQPDELVFEELNTETLNEHLDFLMDGLTSSVFRICNASRLLEDRLIKIPLSATLCEQLTAYNKALKAVHMHCGFRHRRIDPLPALKRPCAIPRNSAAEQRKLRSIRLQTKPLVEATFFYLDPRITISWCLRREIPLSSIYLNYGMRKKLFWATQCTTRYFSF